MNEHAWEVGQQAVVTKPGFGPKDLRIIGVVSKVTATQVVVAVGRSQYRFAKKTDREIGGDKWPYRRIAPATPDLLAAVREERERDALLEVIRHTTPWHKLPTDTLRAVAALLPKQEAKS